MRLTIVIYKGCMERAYIRQGYYFPHYRRHANGRAFITFHAIGGMQTVVHLFGVKGTQLLKFYHLLDIFFRDFHCF